LISSFHIVVNDLNFFLALMSNGNKLSSRKEAVKSSNSTPQAEPGSGLRSLKTTPGFALFNFELYAKPNKFVMVFGLTALTGCIAFLAYMNANSENKEAAVDKHTFKKVSKWE